MPFSLLNKNNPLLVVKVPKTGVYVSVIFTVLFVSIVAPAELLRPKLVIVPLPFIV